MKKMLLMLFVLGFSSTMFGQLSGTYTIPGSYATIRDAFIALNVEGQSGTVTFNVAANHTETCTDSLILTRSGRADGVITFQKNGSGSNPIITRTNAGFLTTSILGGQGDAVVILQGCDYVVFDGIDVATTNQGIEYGYYLRKGGQSDGCKNITIRNCNITMTKGTSAYVAGIYSSNNDQTSLVSVNTGILVQNTDGRNENVTITGNTIGGVVAGILLRGYNHTSAPYDFFDQNFVIGAPGAGNTINNFGGGSTALAYGVYMQNLTSPTISNNTFDNVAGGGGNATAAIYGIYFVNSTTSNPTGGNFLVNNNSFKFGQGSTSSAYAIYTTQLCTSTTITNNTFGFGTFASTTEYMIYASSATNNVVVSYNSTTGTINKTGSGTFYCYYNPGSPTGGQETISNNNFSNVTVAGTSGFYGIYSGTSATQNKEFYSNIISGITCGSGTFTGIYSTYGLNTNIYQNNIESINSGGTTYGIQSGGTSSVTCNTYSNTIRDLNSSGSSAVYGIYATVAATNNIYKNNIYNLQSGGASGTVAGIYGLSGTNLRFYNNVISDLRAPLSSNVNAVSGISFAGGTNASVFYNSVFLNATSSSATNFGTSGLYAVSTIALDMRNNILINKSEHKGNTGFTVAYRRNGAISASNYLAASNTNDFYATSALGYYNYLFYDGTTGFTGRDSTLAAYKTRVSPRDAGSFTEDAPFVNNTTAPFDLHLLLVQTQCESGGTEVAAPIAVNEDFDGNPRYPNPGYPDNFSYPATSPDVGADEFAGMPIFTCTTPDPGNTISNANGICFGQSVTLSLQNPITGTGNAFQWQSSSSENGTYANIADAIAATYTVSPANNAWYRCAVTCQNGQVTVTSNPLYVHYLYEVQSVSGADRCGTGDVKLNATGTGVQLAWYETAVGGVALGYGSPFTTPVISATTTFYVGAESPGPGTITVGSGATTSATYSNPFYSLWSNLHNQHLIKADELIAAGLLPGDITSLGLNITVPGTLPMLDFSLKIGHTTATDLSVHATDILTTVYTSASFMPGAGINSMAFTAPFTWDGVSNILIEICHGNPASTATMSRTCLANTTTYISTIHTHKTTSTAGALICSDVTTNLTTYSLRPQFIIDGIAICSSPRTPVLATVFAPPVLDITGGSTVCNDVIVPLTVLSEASLFDEYIWSPLTDLYTDAAGTVPYTGGTALTVYVRSTIPGTTQYLCTATNNTSYCSNTDVAEITVLPGSAVIVANPASLCISGTATLSCAMPAGYGAATFQWQDSPDGITFNDIPGATNLTYTAQYIGQTTHYQLIIRNGAGQPCVLPQYELVVDNPLITNTVPGFHCGPGTVVLEATGTTGQLIWYDSPNGGTPLGTGSPFTTPYLWESKTYYVSASEPGTIVETAGKATPTGTTNGTYNNYGMVFTTNQYITLQAVDVYPAGASGQLAIALYNSSQTLLEGPAYYTYPAGNGTTPYTIPLGYKIPAGTGYRLLITVMSGGNLVRETTGLSYPIATGSLISLTSAATSLTGTSSSTYNWFYNWRVIYGCASPLTPVLATINLGPFFELTPDQAVCNDERAKVNVENGTLYFDSFTWAPADHLYTDQACTVPYVLGVNAPTVFMKTTIPGNYEIRGYANNTINGCTNFDTTHVVVLPASITILSDPDSICISGSANLTLDPAIDYGASIIQWQVSTDNVNFTNIAGATNSSYHVDVLTATTYYKVIIKNSSYVECVTAEKAVIVDSPVILSTTPGSRCGTGTVDLGATANPGATINWYGSADGVALLGTGSSFTTPVISATTTFYASAGGVSGYETTFGVPTRSSTSASSSQAGLLFNVYVSSLTLEGVNIYPIGTGDGIVNISLRNSVGATLAALSFSCTGTASPGIKTYVPLNWVIPSGVGYYLAMTSRTGLVATLGYDATANILGGPIATNPGCIIADVAQITSGRSGTSGTSTTHYYFYDWLIRTGCASPRVPALATVNAGNPVNITASRTICHDEIHMMTVTSQLGDYDIYTWTPITNLYSDAACSTPYTALENRTTVYFRSATPVITTYTCQGVNTNNGCNSTAQSTVTAIPVPTIVSYPEGICVSGSATLLLTPETGYGIATFQWQNSPDNTVFTDIPGATDQTYNTPVVTAESYYKVIIRNAVGTVCSEPTYTLPVGNPQLLSTTSGERCGPGTVLLGADGTGGTVNWYTGPIGGTPIGTGTSFTTPVIAMTTSYFAGVTSPIPTDGFTGMPASVNGTSGAGTSTYGLYFDAIAPFTLRTVNIYPNSSANNTPGTVTISVINTSGTVLHQAVVNVTGYTQSSNLTVQTVVLNFNILPEHNLRLVMTSKSSGISGLMFHPAAQPAPPYPYVVPGVVSITSGTYGSVVHPELYYYFYNWRVSVPCETVRTEVLASVNVPPDLTLTGSKTICINEVYQLNVTNPLEQFDIYTWSPVDNLFTDAACTQPYVALANASTVYVKAAAGGTTSYTCSSLNLTSLCTNITTAVITVIPAATISSMPEGICESGDATLSISPATGYGLATFQWQDSPDNSVFTDIPGATNQTFTTPTLTTTRYYKILIKNESGLTCTQPVYAMSVYHPEILTTTPGTRCGIGSAVLQATAQAGSTFKWYAAATGGNSIGTGSPFSTPVINATTTFYVSASYGGGQANVGKTSIESNASNGGGLSTYMNFTAASDFVLQTVDLFPYGTGPGTVTIELRTSTGTPIMAQTFNVTGTTNTAAPAQTVTLNFPVTGGASYRLGVNSWTGGVTNLYRDYTGSTTVFYPYPYTVPDVMSITGNSGANYYYYFFYNWSISTGCESIRTAVTATVTPPPSFTVKAIPDELCAFSATTLKATSSNAGYTYVWMPGNMAGANQVVHPGVTTVYTATATDAGTGCVNVGSVTVNVNPAPSAITITPSAPTIDPGSIQPLVATGGTISGSGVFGTTTTTNTTTGYPAPYTNYYGGTKHQMLIRASELTAAGLYPGAPIRSITFTVTAVGSSFGGNLNNFRIDMGETTQTALTSSAFIGGLINVLPPATQPVAVGTVTHVLAVPYTWNGTSNLVIQTSYSNGNNGTSANSVQMTNNNPGFVSTNWYRADGQSAATILAAVTPTSSGTARPNMVIGYGTPTTMTWAPITDLYSDAAATLPYTGQSMTAVWAKPAITRTYTALAANPTSGCSISQSVTVTLNEPAVPANILVTDTVFGGQDSCYNATQTITVAGNGNTFVVQSDATVVMIAGQNIIYLPGTKVEMFGYLHAYITTNNEYCVIPAAPASIVSSTGEGTMFTSSGSIFRLYPNPTTGDFTLEIAGIHGKEKVEVGIYGVHGDKVLEATLEGQNKYKLTLADKPTGIYFVRLISGGTAETLKIIRQ